MIIFNPYYSFKKYMLLFYCFYSDFLKKLATGQGLVPDHNQTALRAPHRGCSHTSGSG